MSIWKKPARLAASVGLLSAGLVLGLVLGGGQTAIGTEPQEAANAVMGSDSRLADMVPQAAFVEVADEVGPAVVFIQATRPRDNRNQGQDSRFQDFFNDFFNRGPQPEGDEEDPDDEFGFQQRAQSQGSGVIISPDGYILTNAHVIAELDQRAQEMKLATEVQVTLQDDRLYDAEIVGADLGTDIALLKVDGSRLPYAEFGNSEQLQVGEWVMAIGAPFGLQNTVSAGIVSAIGRAGLTGMATPYQDFVQTDAAINPGNSGGPLVNLRGEIIGINTAIATGGGFNPSFNGVGFAVPVNLAHRVMVQLRDHGRVIRGYLGVSVQPLGRDLREALQLGNLRGAVISVVNEGGPAEAAGLREDDVVVGVDGERLEGQQDFLQRIAAHAPGDRVDLDVVRPLDEAGEMVTLTVTLSERPSEAEIISTQGQPRNNRRDRDEPDEGPERIESTSAGALGLTVTELTPELRRQLEIPRDIDGVVVMDVAEASPAANAQIEPGDIIRRVRSYIESLDEFDEQMSEFGPGDAVPLRVYSRRFDTSTLFALRIPR